MEKGVTLGFKDLLTLSIGTKVSVFEYHEGVEWKGEVLVKWKKDKKGGVMVSDSVLIGNHELKEEIFVDSEEIFKYGIVLI